MWSGESFGSPLWEIMSPQKDMPGVITFMSKRRTCSNSGVAYFLHVTVSLCLQVFFFFSPLISWCLYAILSATLYNTPECVCRVNCTVLCYRHGFVPFYALKLWSCYVMFLWLEQWLGAKVIAYQASLSLSTLKTGRLATVFPGQRKPAEVQKGAGKTLRSHCCHDLPFICHASSSILFLASNWHLK